MTQIHQLPCGCLPPGSAPDISYLSYGTSLTGLSSPSLNPCKSIWDPLRRSRVIFQSDPTMLLLKTLQCFPLFSGTWPPKTLLPQLGPPPSLLCVQPHSISDHAMLLLAAEPSHSPLPHPTHAFSKLTCELTSRTI